MNYYNWHSLLNIDWSIVNLCGFADWLQDNLSDHEIIPGVVYLATNRILPIKARGRRSWLINESEEIYFGVFAPNHLQQKKEWHISEELCQKLTYLMEKKYGFIYPAVRWSSLTFSDPMYQMFLDISKVL